MGFTETRRAVLASAEQPLLLRGGGKLEHVEVVFEVVHGILNIDFIEIRFIFFDRLVGTFLGFSWERLGVLIAALRGDLGNTTLWRPVATIGRNSSHHLVRVSLSGDQTV